MLLVWWNVLVPCGWHVSTTLVQHETLGLDTIIFSKNLHLPVFYNFKATRHIFFQEVTLLHSKAADGYMQSICFHKLCNNAERRADLLLVYFHTNQFKYRDKDQTRIETSYILQITAFIMPKGECVRFLHFYLTFAYFYQDVCKFINVRAATNSKSSGIVMKSFRCFVLFFHQTHLKLCSITDLSLLPFIFKFSNILGWGQVSHPF